MKSQAQLMPAAFDLVDDVDAARRPIQQDRTAMQDRRAEEGVAVVLGRPARDVAVVDDLDLPGVGMPYPEERTPLGGGVPAGQFCGVVSDGRPEVRNPPPLPLIPVPTPAR